MCVGMAAKPSRDRWECMHVKQDGLPGEFHLMLLGTVYAWVLSSWEHF